MKQATFYLPAKGPVPRSLVPAILRAAQSGVQVQIVRAKVIHV